MTSDGRLPGRYQYVTVEDTRTTNAHAGMQRILVALIPRVEYRNHLVAPYLTQTKAGEFPVSGSTTLLAYVINVPREARWVEFQPQMG